MEELITLTEKAAEAVFKIFEAEGMPKDCRLRVKVVGGGCSGFSYEMNFDEITEGDQTRPALASDVVSPGDRVVEQRGVTLVVDDMSLTYLFGTEIDYVETLAATGFKFNNPTSTSTCGCGSSFSV